MGYSFAQIDNGVGIYDDNFKLQWPSTDPMTYELTVTEEQKEALSKAFSEAGFQEDEYKTIRPVKGLPTYRGELSFQGKGQNKSQLFSTAAHILNKHGLLSDDNLSNVIRHLPTTLVDGKEGRIRAANRVVASAT